MVFISANLVYNEFCYYRQNMKTEKRDSYEY